MGHSCPVLGKWNRLRNQEKSKNEIYDNQSRRNSDWTDAYKVSGTLKAPDFSKKEQKRRPGGFWNSC